MPLKTVYELDCDECDYTADEDEMEIQIFDSQKAAVDYAIDAGWTVRQPATEPTAFICPGCVNG